MFPKSLVLALASTALAVPELSDHVFPFSVPGIKEIAPVAYSDQKSFNHRCFAFVYAVFDKKQRGPDENNKAFLERALPLCNGLLPQTECLFSLSELYKVREGRGAKGTKKEWCQRIYDKVAGIETPVAPTTTTTASITKPQVQPRVKSTTTKVLIPSVKSTTAAPKVKSTTAAPAPRVKSTTTAFAPEVKSTTSALAPQMKTTTPALTRRSQHSPRVKSTTAAPTTTSTTTTSTSTTTSTTTTASTSTTTTTTTSTTTTSADVVAKHSVKAGVDFMKHLRSPVAPLASRAAVPAVLAKSSTSTTTTTSTTTAATNNRLIKPSVSAGVDFMRHIRSARALVAKANPTTTSSWPDTDVECVCFHRQGKRTCSCPEGKTPPPEGQIQGRLLAAAAEANTPSPQLGPQQVLEAEASESAMDSLAFVFGKASRAAGHMFGAFMQRV